nr:hypothetical protein [Proteus mirabilis]
MSAITDRNKQCVDFIYNKQHQLISLSRNGIETLFLHYINSQLSQITLANEVIHQPLVTCRYDK